MEISAQLVKELRDKTGSSMGDCRKALVHTEGNLDKAVIFLREKGLADATKKSGRTTKEGMIIAAISEDHRSGILVEINCETDFVARTDNFIQNAKSIASKVLADAAITKADHLESKVGDALKEMISKMGENITFGNMYRAPKLENGFITEYIHAGGKIGVLSTFTVKNESTKSNAMFQEMARNICMQIAALSPASIGREDINPVFRDEQEQIFKVQLKESGKPENMWDNILKGKMDKFYKENTLLEQQYVKESEKKISILEYINQVAKSLDETITIKNFCRLQLG